MTIEQDFLELMVQTVSVKHPTGVESLYGNRALGAAVEYRARVVATDRMLHDANGDEVAARTVAWIFGAPGITTDCKITLPDGSTPPILAVDRFPDENGDHHERVYFGGH